MGRKDFISVLVSVIGSLLFSLGLKNIFASPYLFASVNKNEGVQMSDFYSKFGNSSNIHSVSEDITIIATDGLNRAQVSELLTVVDSMKPKIIGLDILFLSEQEEDDKLINVINTSSRIVVPYGLTYNEESSTYSIQDSCYFYDKLKNKKYGAVNLEGLSIKSSIRAFKPVFRLSDEIMNNFAVEVVKNYSSESYRELMNRGKNTEFIDYGDVDFYELLGKDLLENRNSPHWGSSIEGIIKNRIVLVGTTKSYADIHTTPIKAEMPGIYIQAYTINTILQKKYINQVSTLWNYVIAIFFTFVFCSFAYYARKHIIHIRGLLIRLCQFFLIVFFIVIGAFLYLVENVYVNFSLSLSMISFSLLMLDVVTGLYWIYSKLR